MDTTSILSQKDHLLKFVDEATNSIGRFKQINRRWRGAITAGMIETGRMKKEATILFEPLIQDMRSTISHYEQIQSRLADAVLVEIAKKVIFEIFDAAGFTINILKRNLFERTADVGYLATDGEIINFLKKAEKESSKEAIEKQTLKIRKRLDKYRYEYTVYNEIIILDLKGNVLANLDRDNSVLFSQDPLLRQTQAIDLHTDPEGDKYIETFRHTDLMPGRGNVLVYSQKIEDPETNTALGTLCLCFDFEDEMKGIFKDLEQGNENIIAAVLDDQGRILCTSNPLALPPSTRIRVNLDTEFGFLSVNGKEYLVSTVPTEGYQGFYGLTWYGCAMVDTKKAFSDNQEDQINTQDIISRVQNYSKDLLIIKKESDNLLSDMKIDGLNGIVQAAKFRDKTFTEILHFVSEIGQEIDGLFNSAIESLQKAIVTSLFNDVQFRAFQGNNIADRNLYERANDVCWWALTPLFRKTLANRAEGKFEEKDAIALKDNLQYINDLYTPYLRLILTDSQGEVVAVSDPPGEIEERFAENGLPRGQEFIGMKIDEKLVRRSMALPSSQDYCVSDFSLTPLYGGRPTYIYSTAVRHPENTSLALGAILIVFDAEPQFQAMLTDILPKDKNKQVIEGSFAVFTDRDKNIISSTHSEHPVGSSLPLENKFFSRKNGQRDATVVELNSKSYAMGLQVSSGYREYKIRDGYKNDIICMVFIPI